MATAKGQQSSPCVATLKERLMAKTRTLDHFKGCIGCGIALAFTVSALGGDGVMQWTMFAFGATYGNLWLSH
jgi:hypothetical protein